MSASIADRAQAALWWERKGRALMRSLAGEKGFSNTEEVGKRVTRAGIVRGDIVASVPSGILNAAPWEDLTGKEQQRIVRELRVEWSKTK